MAKHKDPEVERMLKELSKRLGQPVLPLDRVSEALSLWCSAIELGVQDEDGPQRPIPKPLN